LAAQQGPCDQIIAACTAAGFTQGGGSTGTGLQVDCVIPIMMGVPQPAGATRRLPQVNPQVVAACKARRPDFGRGQVPASAAGIQPARAAVAPPLATPVSPSTSGSAVTSGNGITPSTSGLAAGAGSLQPGLAGTGGVQPDMEKAPKTPRVDSVQPGPAPVSWPMTCQIVGNGVLVEVPPPPGSVDTDVVNFSVSKGPASSGLKPGQCAFEDRAVKASEPSSLCFAQGMVVQGPEAALVKTATKGPTTQMKFMVHRASILFAGGCWWIDHFGVYATRSKLGELQP